MPTLLEKGYIVPPDDMSEREKEVLKNTVSIDYLISFISDRVKPAKIAPTGLGSRLIVLKSGTGTGKSTVLPPYLYKTFVERLRKGIVITQPRVYNAVDIPNSIVQYNKFMALDKNIGYSTKLLKRPPKERGILFCTVGVLTQQLLNNTDEEFMKRTAFVMIDEVHERDIETDTCLYLMKKLLSRQWNNPECPFLIVTSATFDETIFMEYFNVPKSNYISVVGSSFPIENNYLSYSVSNYVQYAAMYAQRLHLDNLDDLKEKNPIRDIIIFVDGAGVGKKIYNLLLKFNSEVLDADEKKINAYSSQLSERMNALHKSGGGRKYYVLPIMLDKASFTACGIEYQNTFAPRLDLLTVPIWKKPKFNVDTDKPDKFVTPSRRIIIATNMAETGVTIDTLKYCIDTGFHFATEFHPYSGCTAMFTRPITRGMATQRRGRVGRMGPGVWHPEYTEEVYEGLQSDQFSQIILTDTTEVILSNLIKEKNVQLMIAPKEDEDTFMTNKLTDHSRYKLVNELETNLSALNLIEMPSIGALGFSIEKLHILGYIDDNYDVTAFGLYSIQIRFLSLELKRMLLAGYHYGADILDLITIAAFVYISKRKVFDKKFKAPNFLKIDDNKFRYIRDVVIADDFINCIFIWNMFQKFLSRDETIYIEELNEWLTEKGLIFDGFNEVIAMRDNIIENFVNMGLDPYKNRGATNLNKTLKASLYEGLEHIYRLKQCIYEGYKCNLLQNKKGQYVSSLYNITVSVDSKLTNNLNPQIARQEKPNNILVDAYAFTTPMGSQQYGYICDNTTFVSVLDNYINIDEGFFLS
jgi:HrpA-like RNA helicase